MEIPSRRMLAAAGALCAGAAAVGWWGAGAWHPPVPVASSSPGPAWTSAVPSHPAPSPGVLVVYVAGAVARPGVYRLPVGRRVDDAVRAAGGLAAAADPLAINLAEPLRDGSEIAVVERGAAPPRAAGAMRSGSPRGRRSRAPRARKAAPAAAEPVDLNTADEAALAALPGIGQALAARIVAFREENGPFESVDGLADVAGITPRRLDAVGPYLTVR